MNKEYCEKIQVSAMAILDGEVPQLSAKQVSEHLQLCADCRYELEQQKQAVELLHGHSRRVFTEDVWSGIAVAIEESKARPKQRQELRPFVALCFFLLTYKIIEVLPGFTPGVAVKLMPLIAVFVFFGLLKQNPFVISQNLRLQGDTR